MPGALSLGRLFLLRLSKFPVSESLSRYCRNLTLGLVAVWGLVSCSAEKDTFVARNWHNLLAHYNSYYIAREKLSEVELTTWKSIKDNYNRPLAVLPPPGQASSQTAALDEIVKKASIPIQRHKNSDWVDDSYLIIGKARYYQDDYENATHTFRYLVSKAKDENVKHAALIWLLRTYTDMKEYSYARQATEAALGKVLDKKNKKDFYLAMAHYHSKFREWPEVLGYVEEALPLMRRNVYRARMEFLAGQLRQRMEDDSMANVHFKMVARCRPPYELGFNAQVNAAQTLAANDENGIRKIRKYFRKQLRDEKNFEYQDKIYYEMARFELKQNDVPKALEFANASLRSKGTTTGMKGYTYLLQGRIFYEKVKRYDLAKIYYDSAVAALDTTEENYKAIVKRQKVLAEFVAQYEIIQKEDSVRALAGLDSNALKAKLTAMAVKKLRQDAELARKAEKEAKIAEREEAARAAAQGTTNGLGGPATTTTGGQNQPDAGNTLWYFYNPGQVARGKALFTRKWGRRPLEDNWRRSKKELENNEEGDGSGTAGGGKDSTGAKTAKTEQTLDGKDGKEKAKEAPTLSEAEAAAALVAQYKQGLPLTDAAMNESDRKLQPALFTIGKIYDQKLEEPDNALASFVRLTKNYPDYDKDPEALYNLYIIYGRKKMTPQADSVKRVLVAKHPYSVFAKLIDDPEYLAKNRAQTEAAKGVYRQAYGSYKEGRYIEAAQGIATIRRQYPENSFRDRVDLLAALITAKTIDPTAYKDSLRALEARYPKSDLQPTIKQMISIADRFGQGAPIPAAPGDSTRPSEGGAPALAPASGTSTSRSGPAAWSTAGMEGAHIYVALLHTGSLTEQEARQNLIDFNSLYYTQEQLSTATLPFNDELFITRAGDLRSKLIAKLYLQKQESLDGAYDYLEPRIQQYIITPENFRELMRTKDVAGYKRFYEQHYGNR